MRHRQMRTQRRARRLPRRILRVEWAMPSNELRLLYRYAWIVGLALLAQGALTVAVLIVSDEGARRTHGVLNHEARHGVLHVLLGMALLALVMGAKRPRAIAVGTLMF